MATHRPGPGGGSATWPALGEEEHERELAFDTGEERLPWLESDDEGEELAGYDMGRLIGLALIMLVVLVAIVGAVWFVSNRGLGAGPAPDGSLIAAPATPYKERPASPGGKTFAGTGDTSYAVGAGKEVEARLATGPATPAPVATPTQTVTPAAPPTPAAPADAGLPAGTAVQVGAYSSRADAEAGWQRLAGQTDALEGVAHRIVAGRADIGTVYRLQAAGGSRENARALCDRLKAAGIACQVK
ncbi:SPOR domain-containing protein [Qipengyuania sediminis]|uniref:SPOR domain-containing protein n=1 Tax=Qipengyuania sediminis TaxID=1532023 RepID=UPI00105A7468|nr:SPOR domain-containing protein [Qipengyuania sediminis]